MPAAGAVLMPEVFYLRGIISVPGTGNTPKLFVVGGTGVGILYDRADRCAGKHAAFYSAQENAAVTFTGYGSLTATAGEAAELSVGICVSGPLTVDGEASAAGVGGNGGSGSVGVSASGSITVSGRLYGTGKGSPQKNTGICCAGGTMTVNNNASVFADGVSADTQSCGIQVYNSTLSEPGSLKLQGGVVTAAGETQALSCNVEFGDNVTAQASVNSSGSGADTCDRDSIGSYKWFRSVSLSGLRVGDSEEVKAPGEITGTGASAGKASLSFNDSGDPVLTLTDFVYEGEGHENLYNSSYGAVYYDGTKPLTVELVGTNKLTQKGGSSSWSPKRCGFYTDQASVTFAGSGSLTAGPPGSEARLSSGGSLFRGAPDPAPVPHPAGNGYRDAGDADRLLPSARSRTPFPGT